MVPYGNEPFIFVNLKTDPAKNCSCSLNMNGELSGNDHLDREGIELVFFLLWLHGFLGFFCGSVVFFFYTLTNFSNHGRIKRGLRSRAQAGKVSAFCPFFESKKNCGIKDSCV